MFTQENMQHRSAGVFCLQFILQAQRFVNIVGIINRQLA
jgi:hypothetical protein